MIHPSTPGAGDREGGEPLAGTCRIALSQGLYAVVDAEDFDRLCQMKWYANQPGSRGTHYAERDEDGKSLSMHREIMNPSPGFHVDHINGNGLDNRRCNLRIASIAQNAWNKSKSKADWATSKFKGVSKTITTGSTVERWKAEICVNKKRIGLGVHKTEIEAAQAYNEAALLHYGEFARLNEIPALEARSAPEASSPKGPLPATPEVTP